jgi:hypothetical protein
LINAGGAGIAFLRIKAVAPWIQPGINASRRLFPLYFRWQAALFTQELAHPVAKGSCLIPAHTDNWKIDIPGREFMAAAPNLTWLSDITYVRTDQGVDLLGRRVGPLCTKDCWLGDGILSGRPVDT